MIVVIYYRARGKDGWSGVRHEKAGGRRWHTRWREVAVGHRAGRRAMTTLHAIAGPRDEPPHDAPPCDAHQPYHHPFHHTCRLRSSGKVLHRMVEGLGGSDETRALARHHHAHDPTTRACTTQTRDREPPHSTISHSPRELARPHQAMARHLDTYKVLEFSRRRSVERFSQMAVPKISEHSVPINSEVIGSITR